MKSFSVLGSIYNAKQLEAKVKAIKSRLMGFVTITKGDSDFDFMLELYSRYYPWQENGTPRPDSVVDLIAKHNQESDYPKSSPTFFWIVSDGTEHHWNPKHCVRIPTPREEARKAFRTAIQGQIIDKLIKFRERYRTENPRCPVTGLQFDPQKPGEYDIHHEVPEFDTILSEFLEITGIELTDVATKGENRTELADKTIEVMFQDYHAMRANLVVLSKAGHDIVTHKRVTV